MTAPTSAKLLEEFDSAKVVARALFADSTLRMPSAIAVTRQAILEALGEPPFDLNYIKDNFSRLVSDVQSRAYGLYLEAERRICGPVLADYVGSQTVGEGKDNVLNSLSASFFVLDRFCLSLTQSRRTRAGSAFETVVTTLFEALGYPYTFQPELSGSKPDFVLPNLAHYGQFAADCLIFTCKRSLRERWRQVVTEGLTGQAFYLATIDEDLTAAELEKMKGRNVIVVVPVTIKSKFYATALNVISFEVFFDHHLDPAVNRWKAHGVI
ncbi:MAG: hypothetical protein K2W81_14130 [Sphingomonas sp.]|uniref:type II restriction endonuclease n=1 Tax=Sphingomonas sp. TaxID=28214 RepID=UPI0025D53DFE|nr:type II restriction endonuclease [Sphingomonas sp.]MBY0285086.1 hypothetical protein [Sphingomonas sp.]